MKAKTVPDDIPLIELRKTARKVCSDEQMNIALKRWVKAFKEGIDKGLLEGENQHAGLTLILVTRDGVIGTGTMGFPSSDWRGESELREILEYSARMLYKSSDSFPLLVEMYCMIEKDLVRFEVQDIGSRSRCVEYTLLPVMNDTLIWGKEIEINPETDHFDRNLLDSFFETVVKIAVKESKKLRFPSMKN